MNERELIQKCAASDKSALNHLVEAYMPQIYNSVCRTLHYYNSRENPDDLAQSVFLKILDNNCKTLVEFRFRSSLKTYLSVIAANETIKHLRQKSAKIMNLDGLISELAQPEPSQRLIDILPGAISRLEPRDRLAIKLFYEKGLPYNQLARLLHVSQNTVGALLSRAREKLKGIISQISQP